MNPMYVDREGRYKMSYVGRPFNVVEEIQNLQRFILNCSFAYYQLDDSFASDRMYDRKSYQLVEMLKQYPEEAKRSRYYKYFHDYTGETGYHLTDRIRKEDPELYRLIWMQVSGVLRTGKALRAVGEVIDCPNCDGHASVRRTGMDTRAYVCGHCSREYPYPADGWAYQIDELVNEFKDWYIVDVIRPWSVRFGLKGAPDRQLDIRKDRIEFYGDEYAIPDELGPAITKIQELLVDLSKMV